MTYGALYWIPYGALLPRELDNLLVAGRCISVDHRVHHATKEIPACFASGEAAGAAAALAVARDITPAALDVATRTVRASRLAPASRVTARVPVRRSPMPRFSRPPPASFDIRTYRAEIR